MTGLDIAQAKLKRRKAVEGVATTEGVKRLTRLIAYYGVRNSELEDLHAGMDHTHAEVAWEDVSRISDPEMRSLMLNIEHELGKYLAWLILTGVISVNEGEYSTLQLGDWHGILNAGPSYDRVDWT